MPDYPKEYDATLGGQNPPPTDGAVLGGIKGVKQRFASGNENERLNSLPQLIKYRQEGLDLVIQALKDSSKKVQLAAYKLLKAIPELKVQQAILEFNPYRYFDCVYTLPLGYHPAVIAIHPNGETLISCSGGNSKHERQNSDGSYTGGVYLDFTPWNLKTGNKLYSIQECFGNRIKDSIDCYAVSRDTTTLAVGGTQYDSTIIIQVWNFHNEHLSHVISGQPLIESGRRSNITSMALSCNGKILAIGNAAAKISVWDLEVSKEIYTLWKDLKPITALAVNAETKILAAGSDDNNVSVWNLNNGNLIYDFGDSEHGASYLTISPNGQFLIVGYKSTPAIIKIWDLRFGHNIGTLYPNNGKLNFFTISQDGKVLVICGNKIMIYNLKTRQLLATLPHSCADSVNISSDGQTIASYKYKEVKVWQVR